MDEEQKAPDAVAMLTACAERLASAAVQIEKTLAGVQSQYESLNAKVDRIVAAIDESLAVKPEVRASGERGGEVETRRKTLSPTVSLLLSKSGVEASGSVEDAVLEKALSSLSIEQRIAVKAEMARAGLIG